MTKSSLGTITGILGGALILLSLILPWNKQTTLTPIQGGSSAFKTLALTGCLLFGSAIILLSVAIANTQNHLRTRLRGLGLLLSFLALVFYAFWVYMIITNPFRSPPGGRIFDVGLGIYSGFLGSLIALAGLVIYRFQGKSNHSESNLI